MKNVIGVFDSGIGGLSTLNEIRKLLSYEDYLYICDSKNNPYGEKNDEELYSIVKSNVDYLLKKNSKIIVIACNTATTRCISKLRKEYKDTIFVGTEPAIKLACDSGYNNILLLATPLTISSKRTNELINTNININQIIYKVSCEGLANAIELNDQKRINKLLHIYLDNYIEKDIDCIILGCTHYPYIKDKIQKYFPNSNIIDGNKGVSNRVKYLLEKNNLLSLSNKKGKISIKKNR